jgi:hypothetical protein
MKDHCIKGAIVVETKEQLARELDRLLDKYIHSIAKKDKCMLVVDTSDRAMMKMREVQ